MVLLLVKGTNGNDDFCWETKCSALMDEVSTGVCTVHNARIQARRLGAHLLQLAKYGPIRDAKEIGLSVSQAMEMGNKSNLGDTEDPLAQRVGRPVAPEVATTIERTVQDMNAYISKQQADMRVALSIDEIKKHAQLCRGAMMIAFPMGLPTHDPINFALNFEEDFSTEEDSKNLLDAKTCTVWFAGKAMSRELPASKFIGTNENATVKVKLTAKGKSAPAREVDEDARRRMMQMYHEKQKKEKDLAENDEDEYLNSAWANPKSYKAQLHGFGGGIRF